MKIRFSILVCSLCLVAGLISCKGNGSEDKTIVNNTTNNGETAPKDVEPTSEVKPESKEDVNVQPKTEKPVVKAPAPKAPEVKKETKELSINGNQLTIDKKTGKYKYCTNCRRRASRYYYYYFDKTEYEKIVGVTNLKKRVKIQVIIESKNASIYKPKDSASPQPDGGFQHNHYTCKVVKLISDK